MAFGRKGPGLEPFQLFVCPCLLDGFRSPCDQTRDVVSPPPRSFEKRRGIAELLGRGALRGCRYIPGDDAQQGLGANTPRAQVGRHHGKVPYGVLGDGAAWQQRDAAVGSKRDVLHVWHTRGGTTRSHRGVEEFLDNGNSLLP